VTEWVGTFWCVHDERGQRILADRIPLSAAKERGGYLVDDRCPYEVWARWQKLGYLGIREVKLSNRIIRNECDHFPRGSVGYCLAERRFALLQAEGLDLTSHQHAQLRTLFLPGGELHSQRPLGQSSVS